MIIRYFGVRNYKNLYNKMLFFKKNRSNIKNDEIWFAEYNKSFTCGKDKFRIFNKVTYNFKNKIPIYFNDRGGGVIYHSPGQIIIYTLINIKKYNLCVKNFVYTLEEIIISFLNDINIDCHKIFNMNGIYVNNKKICFIGLKILNGFVYYGLAINVNMNLYPFNYIFPCGYNIKVTQIYNFNKIISMKSILIKLKLLFIKTFNIL